MFIKHLQKLLIVLTYLIISFVLSDYSISKLWYLIKYVSTTYIVKHEEDMLYRMSSILGINTKKPDKINKTCYASYHIKAKSKLRNYINRYILVKQKVLSLNYKNLVSKNYHNTININSLPTTKYRWVWPSTGKVVVPYSHAMNGNKGIDISSFRGAPIFAAEKGKVVYVGNQLPGYGNLIMIKHGKDYITAYAHNDTILVNNGQNVTAGQKIATMGDTGTNFVLLHFQMRYKETAIDPQQYLPKKNK